MDASIYSISVSYTHLDVYKRQAHEPEHQKKYDRENRIGKMLGRAFVYHDVGYGIIDRHRQEQDPARMPPIAQEPQQQIDDAYEDVYKRQAPECAGRDFGQRMSGMRIL